MLARPLLILTLAAVAAAGCGSSDGSPANDDSDTRATVFSYFPTKEEIVMGEGAAAIGAAAAALAERPAGQGTIATVRAWLGEGIAARLAGDEEIAVDGPGNPRIRFYLTAGEAEAAQFEGDGEGAEQIGAALLFVKPEITDASEDLLEKIENCLADQ